MNPTERGAAYFKKITDAYLEFALDVVENREDAEAVKGLSFGFGKDARLVIRAIELMMLDGTESDYWVVLKAMECAKVKDDGAARELFDDVKDDVSVEWAWLKDAVRAQNGAKPKEKVKPLAVRVAELIQRERDASASRDWNVAIWANDLLKFPEVERALAALRRKASAK